MTHGTLFTGPWRRVGVLGKQQGIAELRISPFVFFSYCPCKYIICWGRRNLGAVVLIVWDPFLSGSIREENISVQPCALDSWQAGRWPCWERPLEAGAGVLTFHWTRAQTWSLQSLPLKRKTCALRPSVFVCPQRARIFVLIFSLFII